MNPTSGVTPPSGNPMNYTAGAPGRASLVQIGAGLGIASNCIGWAIFLMMCFGFGKAVYLSILPFGLACVGMVLTVVGGVYQKDPRDADTHVLASLFVNLFGLVGGIMQIAVWLNWKVLPGMGVTAAGSP
jgi:hypothetical protein